VKVWTDLSAIVKIAFICVVVGFLLGLCASGVVHARLPAATASVASKISVAAAQVSHSSSRSPLDHPNCRGRGCRAAGRVHVGQAAEWWPTESRRRRRDQVC
jgi:hypothetical protein